MMATKQSSKQDKTSQLSKPKQASLTIFFLDGSAEFSTPQSELLALALRMQEQGFVPYICCPSNSTLMQKAKEQGLPTISIASEGCKKPSLMGFLRLFWLQKRNQPLCIHCFAENCLPLAQRLSKIRLENSTLVLHSCFDTPKRGGKSLPAYWALPKKIIYTSKYMANMWAEAGVDPAQSAVIHTAYANINANNIEKPKRWVFLALEDLEENSGLDILLKAMSALWQHPYLPEWEVRVVGKGSLFEQIFAEAQSLGVASRLALLGSQPLENVLPYAHVLISPHIGPQGNIPALMAAWAVGIPLVCTTVNAHMEVAHSGNAFTVPAIDPQRLASAMIELMCRPERVEIFYNLSATMNDYAKIPRLLDQYSNLYHDCIARHGWVLPVQTKTEEQN